MATLLETKLSENPAKTEHDEKALTKEQQDTLNQQKVGTVKISCNIVSLFGHVSRLI